MSHVTEQIGIHTPRQQRQRMGVRLHRAMQELDMLLLDWQFETAEACFNYAHALARRLREMDIALAASQPDDSPAVGPGPADDEQEN